MNKYLGLLLLSINLLFSSQTYSYFINDKHGFIMKDKFEFSYSKIQMNDKVDILKIKDSELGNTNSTSLGDLKGEEYFLRYKIYDDALISYKQQKINLDYGLGNLDNKKEELYIRHNLFSKSFSIDLGIEKNSANDINSSFLFNKAISEIKSRNLINVQANPAYDPVLANIIPNYNISPYTASYLGGDQVGTPYSNVDELLTNVIDNVGITNMSDETLFIRATRSFVEDSFYSYDIFAGYGYTKVNSFLDIKVKQGLIYTTNVEQEISKQDIQNLARNEHKFLFGFNHSWFINDWYMDIGYEFNYIKRDKGLTTFNKNHKLSGYLGYQIFNNSIIFVGVKLMTNQFVGEIPYLYNEYTQSSFDKKYGWVKTGILIKF